MAMLIAMRQSGGGGEANILQRIKGIAFKSVPLRALLTSLILLQTALLSPLWAMDLMEAYGRAKDHAPLFGAALYENEAARTLSKQGRSLLLPRVELTGALSRYSFINSPANYLDYDSKTLGLSLRQPLLDLRRYHESRQYKIRESIGEVKFAQAEQNLILRVAEAYFHGLAAGNLLELIAAEKEAALEQQETGQENVSGRRRHPRGYSRYTGAIRLRPGQGSRSEKQPRPKNGGAEKDHRA